MIGLDNERALDNGTMAAAVLGPARITVAVGAIDIGLSVTA